MTKQGRKQGNSWWGKDFKESAKARAMNPWEGCHSDTVNTDSPQKTGTDAKTKKPQGTMRKRMEFSDTVSG